MSRLDRESLEAELLELHAAGAHDAVAERLVEGYGPEVVGFLSVMLGPPERAQDVFQTVCEDVLRALPGFRREASFRTWLYGLDLAAQSGLLGAEDEEDVRDGG